MTEAEWRTGIDPEPMFELLRHQMKYQDRKWQLFACAAGRRVWGLMPTEKEQGTVEFVEQLADNPRLEIERDIRVSPLPEYTTRRQIRSYSALAQYAAWFAANTNAWQVAYPTSQLAMEAAVRRSGEQARRGGLSAGADMRGAGDARREFTHY